MRRLSVISVLLVTLVVVFQSPGVHSLTSYVPTSSAGLSGNRNVPMNIRVIFIGLTQSDINSSYLTNNIISPSEKPQSILAGSQGTGVQFKFNYQVQFANSSVAGALSTFLNGIGKRVDTPVGAPNQYVENPYFDNVTSNISTVTNWFYNATEVGHWDGWSKYFGGNPVPGYTLLVADLHNDLPSFTYSQYKDYTIKCTPLTSGGQCVSSNRGTAVAHYYNRTVVEPDLHYRERRHFMTGWGVDERSYFIDLSAGPSYWTGNLPIQVAEGLRTVAQGSWYGRYWVTKFVADYLAGVIYNLFSPDQLYPVNYSAKYVFHLFFLDARNASEILAGPSLQNSVNLTVVKSQLAQLVPYANVTVIPTFRMLSSDPGLAAVVNNATTKTYDKLSDSFVVDERLVYNWLSTYSEGHISRFVNVTRTISQIDIPAFVFAFEWKNDFGVSFKGDVFERGAGSIFGEALGDIVLIGHGQHDLTYGNYTDRTGLIQRGTGVGYTRTIIHELGHMLGLNHPFLYDLDEDFVESVMGYYANSLVFSQFDKDLILRGVNDELLIFAQVTLANTTSSFLNAGAISSARRSMAIADRKYSSMDYAGAVVDSLAAAESAFQAHQVGIGFLSPELVFGIIGVVVGIAIGLLAGFLAFRKRPPTGIQYYRCPTCGQTLRWDPAIMRWYCNYCQKPV